MKRYETEEFKNKIKERLGLSDRMIATEFCFLSELRNEKICNCHCFECLKKSLDFLSEEIENEKI